MPTSLSQHFNVEDLVLSSDHPQLVADSLRQALEPAMIQNGRALAQNILEPLLLLFPQGITLHSGFRGDALNVAVGGSPKSQHRAFLAVDFLPTGIHEDKIPWAFAKVMEWGLRSPRPTFRQLLSEGGNIHIGHANGGPNDGQVGGWAFGKLTTWFEGL